MVEQNRTIDNPQKPKLIERKKSNAKLHLAKKLKYDEFYTYLEDIENELRYYWPHFKGKVVYCNCDNPSWSNFFKYFSIHFEELGLKGLISSYMSDSEAYAIKQYKPFTQEDYEAIKQRVSPYLIKLDEGGGYSTSECLELLNEADIVVTNPPFSEFEDYTKLLLGSNKEFIILGDHLAGFNRGYMFDSIKAGRLRVGWGVVSKFFSLNEQGKPDEEYSVRGAPCLWYTTLTPEPEVVVKETPVYFRPYLNFDGVDVTPVKNLDHIPKDYSGIVGVPVTFIKDYWRKYQDWELLGTSRKLQVEKGKTLFIRVLIKRKQTT